MRVGSSRVPVRWRLRLLQGLFSEGSCREGAGGGGGGGRRRGEMLMKPVAKKKVCRRFFFSGSMTGFYGFFPPCRSAFTVHLKKKHKKTTGPSLREKYVNFYASNPLQNRQTKTNKQKHCRELKTDCGLSQICELKICSGCYFTTVCVISKCRKCFLL